MGRLVDVNLNVGAVLLQEYGEKEATQTCTTLAFRRRQQREVRSIISEGSTHTIATRKLFGGVVDMIAMCCERMDIGSYDSCRPSTIAPSDIYTASCTYSSLGVEGRGGWEPGLGNILRLLERTVSTSVGSVRMILPHRTPLTRRRGADCEEGVRAPRIASAC